LWHAPAAASGKYRKHISSRGDSVRLRKTERRRFGEEYYKDGLFSCVTESRKRPPLPPPRDFASHKFVLALDRLVVTFAHMVEPLVCLLGPSETHFFRRQPLDTGTLPRYYTQRMTAFRQEADMSLVKHSLGDGPRVQPSDRLRSAQVRAPHEPRSRPLSAPAARASSHIRRAPTAHFKQRGFRSTTQDRLRPMVIRELSAGPFSLGLLGNNLETRDPDREHLA